MGGISSLRAVASLAFARLRHRRLDTLLVAIGVGAGTVMLLATASVSLLAKDASVSRALRSVPPGERVVRAASYRLDATPGEYPTLNAANTKTLPAAHTSPGVARGVVLGS